MTKKWEHRPNVENIIWEIMTKMQCGNSDKNIMIEIKGEHIMMEIQWEI